MINQTHVDEDEQAFAEKCREALEKSCGFQISVPKCIFKKTIC
jgi:predicted nucleic acid-binding Zn ribbon protein